MSKGFDTVIYGVHTEAHVLLGTFHCVHFVSILIPDKDPSERQVLSAADQTIHVFWHNLIKQQDGDSWPADRRWRSKSGKSWTGVFIVYSSVLDPLDSIGRPGDLWITANRIFQRAKDETGKAIWKGWRADGNRSHFCMPWDNNLWLTWSEQCVFKYVRNESVKNSRERWRSSRAIPLERRSAEIENALAKEYHLLSTADILLLANFKLQLIRSEFVLSIQYRLIHGCGSRCRSRGSRYDLTARSHGRRSDAAAYRPGDRLPDG